LSLTSVTSTTSNTSDKPSVLVIMTDDQPYYTIPYMDAVSSAIRDRGVTFSPYAYVSTPICGPARAALLTGKWSHNTRLTTTTDAYEKLHASGYESDTIATRLKNAGYATFFGGKYTNGYDGQDVPPGWDEWFAMVELFNRAASFSYRTGTQIKVYDRAVHNETDVLRQRAVRFVKRWAGSSQPWFAYVCPHAPHAPYYPAPSHADEFTTNMSVRDAPSVGEEDLSDKPEWVQAKAPYTDSERQQDTEAYRGKLQELQEVDDMVKRLMGALADTNQLANTWVFFLTDNGELLGEQGLVRKNAPYEEASRTPFIVRRPGLPHGVKSTVMVSHIDLPPTLLDLAGVPWSDLDGRSLVPVLANGGARPDEWRNAIFVEDPGLRDVDWNMLRTPRYAYVEWENGERELYDMKADPYQLQSLHTDPDKADLIAQLSSRLSAMKSCSGDSCRTIEAAP
jgi:N-acetylglucosamine-6-sulfatase